MTKQQTMTIQQAIDLGVEHHNAGRLPEAENIYNQILQAEPKQPVALHLLGVIAHQAGKNDIALELIEKALAINPDLAEAHSNLGLVFQELGKVDEAVASYHKALAINPDLAEAHSNLGLVFQELGKLDEAFIHQRRATILNPENGIFWAGFAQSIRTLNFTSVDEDLWRQLLRLLDQSTIRPSDVVSPIIRALRRHPEFSQLLEIIEDKETAISTTFQETATELSRIPLFLRLISLTPISDLRIEGLLTFLRRSMLQEILKGNIEDEGMSFISALALQCFTNEYVYSETDEETRSVKRLEQQISELVEHKLDVPSFLIVTLATYRPLHTFTWAKTLVDREWDDEISAVIKRQIEEPFTELSLRSKILSLTSVQDTVSKSVQEQYEENPYPRWVNSDLTDKGKSTGSVLRELNFDIGEYQAPERPDILIAGCGTGQHALSTASRFKDSNMLAVDLSLSSLSYAMRKTQELGVTNIEYAQADIMELAGLGRQFDLIESVGVLHHLGDPLTGWNILVDLLRPAGVMKIGLYSETACKHIVEGRSMIANKGYSTSPEDMRQCRRDIIAMVECGNKDMAKIHNMRDFFSLSEYRDLLFHVQEHRFTLPQINAALKSLKLEFLGFEMFDQAAVRKFKETYPKKRALTSLSLWHKFELENPDTFIGMYQFWCKKV